MKCHLIITLVAIIILSSLSDGVGQKSDINERTVFRFEESAYSKHYFRIGITPSAFLNVYPAIQLNAALNVSDNFQFNVEVGRIYDSFAFRGETAKGYRFRPALRWYVDTEDAQPIHFTISYNLRKTRATKSDQFTLSDGTEVPALQYTQDRKVSGLALLVGYDNKVFDWLIFDLALGLGYGNLTIVDRDIPPSSIKSGFRFNHNTPGTYGFPIFIFNVKFQAIF